MRLHRIKWKRPPTDAERRTICMATYFGPSVYECGNEWVFLPLEGGIYHAPAPGPGWSLVNGSMPK